MERTPFGGTGDDDATRPVPLDLGAGPGSYAGLTLGGDVGSLTDPAPATEPETQPTPRERRGRNRELWPAKVRPADLMQLSRSLSAFIRAGIPILDALALLGEDTENATLKRTLADMAAALREGESLSGALDRHPKVFPVAYRSMLRSAELTGNLDTVLDRVASYIERDIDARSKIRSASVYPMVIVVMSVAVVVLLTTFVLPKFKVFFRSFHQELPLPTRLLLGLANVMETWWWLLLLLLAAVVGGAVAWYRSDGGRSRFDNLVLKVPVLRDVLRYAMVERFCRILGSMMQAGVALPEAMEVCAQAMNNVHVRRAVTGAREGMMRGEGIAGPLARGRFLPAAATQMLRVGEDTGSLDDQLEAAAVYYERELDYKIKKLTSLFEPAVLVFMGLIVGFVAIALISAMYGIFRHTKVG